MSIDLGQPDAQRSFADGRRETPQATELTMVEGVPGSGPLRRSLKRREDYWHSFQEGQAQVGDSVEVLSRPDFSV